MALAKTVGVHLDPALPQVPARLLLEAWREARFDPRSCRDSLERMIREGAIAERYLDPTRIERGERPATDALLFPEITQWVLTFTNSDPHVEEVTGEFEQGQLPLVAFLINRLVKAQDLAPVRERLAAVLGNKVSDALCSSPPAVSDSPSAAFSQTGIYRREHASLYIRSRSTGLLVDPISLSVAGRQGGFFKEVPTAARIRPLDAIVLTHSHNDHWHLPSILRHAPNAQTPVLAPQVPQMSLLTKENLAEMLRKAGQEVLAPAWNSTINIGDIEIEVLPFYGEQPTRDAPGPDPRLRNWGNCYRFNAPDFSALVLVDSGADPAGDMVDVVERSVRKSGPIDVVLACVRQFACPFFGGLSSYCLTLPFARLQELFAAYEKDKLPAVTAGPEGIVRLCAVAQARYFLPYANGFFGLGREIPDVGWGNGEPSERAVMRRIAALMRERGIRTTPMMWNPGDRAVIAKAGLAIEPHGS